jgi:PAS domain S-box-containing protein
MSNLIDADRKWNQRGNGACALPIASDSLARRIFEASSDAIMILDPEKHVFIDCNEAAIKLARSGDKAWLLSQPVLSLAPERQPDGRRSEDRMLELIDLALREGTQRFEWSAINYLGEQYPLEILLTPVSFGDQRLLVVVSRGISERKQAEAEIRRLNQDLERRIAERTAELSASEARLRTLVENAPEAIVVFDGETGRFVSSNENALRLYGLSREQLEQMGPLELSPELQPDGRRSEEVVRQKVEAALAGGRPVFEWTHRHSSGRLISCEIRLVRLPCEGRALLRASILDNTEHHRRELVQRATFDISEAAHDADDLPSLYSRIHAIVKGLMAADNFYIALYNRETEVVSFPYFVDEFSGPPAPCKLTTGLTGYVLRTGKPLLVDREMSAHKRPVAEGVVIEGLTSLAYVESGPPAAIWLGVPLELQGRACGVVAVQDYRDAKAYGEEEKQILSFVAAQIAQAIDRKRAAQALRESEAKHRALFEATAQGVMLHDEERILEVNPAIFRILGFRRPEEIIGKHPAVISSPIQANGVSAEVLAKQHIQTCMSQGHTRFDWSCRNPQGLDVPIEVILTRIQMGGRFLIQAVINDITDRKRTEAELLKALAHEKELGQLKSGFVSLVSHEFRTPLGIIMSSAEILEDYLDQLDPEDRRQHLQSIQKHTRRMAQMMEEVLLLGCFDAGKMEFKPLPLDLRSMCQRLVNEVLETTNHQSPIELLLDLAESGAVGDESLIHHIFTNLLTNAVKYSTAGSPVQFRVERSGFDALCRIEDRGIGIPELDRERLFSAFYRGRNVGSRPGTGLGLVIVKRCVELHGGKLEVTSTPGEGSTFTVRLPLFPKGRT